MGKISTLSHDPVSGAAAWNVTASVPSKRKISGRGLRGAYIALLAFMVIYCARPEDWIPGLTVVPLEKIAGFLALAALVSSIWSIRERLPREVIYLILLIGQMFAAALMSAVSWRGALHTTVDFAKVLLIVIVMVLSARTMARLRSLIFVQALSVALVAVITVWKGHVIEGRLIGVLGNYYADPNDLALIAIISLPLCLAFLVLSTRWIWKSLWAVAMLMMLYAVLLTGSRGGFFALIVTAVACLWEFGIRRRRYFLLLIAVTAGLMLWHSSGKLIGGRLGGMFDSGNVPGTVVDDVSRGIGSAQQREQLLRRSVELTIDHPLFGVGPGNFIQLSGNWHVTHNSYTQMSSEGGLPALVLYVLILWTGLKNLRTIKLIARQKRKLTFLAGALQAALAGYLVGSFFLSLAYVFFPYFLVTYTTVLVLVAKEASSDAKRHGAGSHRAPSDEFYSPILAAPDSPLY